LFIKFSNNSPNGMEGYMAGEVELVRGFAGPMIASFFGLMK